MTILASIPSPSEGVWHLGPFPLRAYAFAILIGIFFAAWLTGKRWEERGGNADEVYEIAYWAVPFGIVGGRLYHVISSPDAYFGAGGDPLKAFAIWEGGLGIWGAVALGAVGAYIGCRRAGVSFGAFADALAPGLLIAQAIGRLGNWFNQELFGRATTLPWGLEVSPDVARNAGYPVGTLFHPTFLYELLWNLAAAGLLIYLDRRFRLGHGRVFWLYVVLYTAGRLWIELLRIDAAETILGLRLNVWTSIIVGLGALVAFIVVGHRGGGREESVYLDPSRAAQAGTDAPADAGDELAVASSERVSDSETDTDSTPDAESVPEISDAARNPRSTRGEGQEPHGV
ncbi:prolipoprotein diacylglyceryl transferase [Sanguibacter gelidistatuariae]|uniref:prolipoprotein diacylglyceryl transferase n=1 Tax=Sanguibacter gelidistatuariae TaxID=1814289 RepID=UPI000B80A166|nr:prolipoprotein diacylglyceryl transferase [Sanguibacter gelidistatuariae]